MFQSVSKVAAVLACAALARAAPAPAPVPLGSNSNDSNISVVEKRGFSCSSLVYGLNSNDCNYMSSIGMAGQGTNALSDNGNIWIGDDGPNTFSFYNAATVPYDVPVTLIVWDMPAGDYQSSFMNVRTPKISFSLPNPGDSVTISMADGVSGGWSALDNYETTLSEYGQIYNTWGEFTTGTYATIDISREVNMAGNTFSFTTNNGCYGDLNTCAYQCSSGNTCGDSGSYTLVNCDPGSQPGAGGYFDGTNWSGGCQGWDNDGKIIVFLGFYN